MADDCPGHPDALGTSRTLVVDPREHPRIGTMQYGETLPLEDGEVVLTFDDGPLPRYSNQVLDILAAQCVKATFFMVGRMAQAYPEGVRKMRDAGHTIGTHSQNHPLSFHRMPLEQAKQEIDDGIASIAAALGDGSRAGAVLPDSRPAARRRRSKTISPSQGIQTWSADFPADDWRHISAARVYDSRCSGSRPRAKAFCCCTTSSREPSRALPRILQRAEGARLSHRPCGAGDAGPAENRDRAAAMAAASDPSETVAISRWPAVPNFVFADTSLLPAPALSDFDLHQAQLVFTSPAKPRRMARGEVPLPQSAPWPRQWSLLSMDAGSTLPVPARSVFQIPEKTHAQPLTRCCRGRTNASANARADTRSRRASDHARSGGGLRRRLFAPVAQVTPVRNNILTR